MIGDDIIVEVVAIQNGKVRLRIIAPDYVEVHHEEVYYRMNDKAGEF